MDEKFTSTTLKDLANFRSDLMLKKAVFGFMANQLISKSEKEKIAQMFKNFDKNGDGKLDKQEIKDGYSTFMKKIMGDDEIDKIF